MPKAKNTPTPEEQRRRFEAEVARLLSAGELSPTEAESELDRLIRQQRKT